MSRISSAFSNTISKSQGAYIPYICAGDPNTDFTINLIRKLDEAGADIFELGLPFSDPIADGPVIQKAMMRSLSSGFRTKFLFDIISQIRENRIDKPIVVMSYLNPILKMGYESFCRRLTEAGGDAILVVDMPIEESDELHNIAKDNSLDMIQLVTPSTPESRIPKILDRASGFIYAVSVAGTTGARETLPDNAITLIEKVTKLTKIPVSLGFGISTPAHAKEAISIGAAGVIEGSKLISIYGDFSIVEDERLMKVTKHAKEMKAALHK